MSIPGFNAESAVRPAKGTYRTGAGFGSGETSVVPQLKNMRCTTYHSGYISYPIRICSFPQLTAAYAARFVGPGAGARLAPLNLLAFLDRFCTTRHGPWYATVEQSESCTPGIPDRFILTISGVPNSVFHEWYGTMADAPPPIGSLAHLGSLPPACACCGAKKMCLDGSCVPYSVNCDGPVIPT